MMVTVVAAGGVFYLRKCEWNGFENVNENEGLMVGDIVVFQPIGGRKFGHIAIWNGKQWVSDFKQRSIIVHSDYRSQDCEYAVFRRRQR